MAGPWEQFTPQQAASPTPVAGPWEKFAPVREMAGPPIAPTSDQSFLGRVKDNVIGVDDGVLSTGERIGQLIRGAGAATARGIADVPALPANLLQLGATGVEKLTGMDDPSMVSRALNALPDTRDMLASVPVIGPESEYKAPGVLGDYVSTVGEFAGGAGMAAGPSALMRYGVAPGVASETAGQLTEGTAAEPYARAVAGIATAILASPKAGAFAADDEASRMANKLQENGVRNITKGQATGSQPLMRAEGRLQATSQQIDDFTASAMRQIGSAEKLATPSSLRAAEKAIVSQMDDAVRGVSFTPNANVAIRAINVAKDYAERVPQGNLTPRIRGIAKEIRGFAVSKRPVTLAQLKEWRSDIGRLTVSSDAATREAAHALRRLIDETTDTALASAGRTEDIAKLAAGRESYRNYIGVRDAASRAGAEGGTLSPQALNQSFIRAQGREAYATGRTTSMADFTRAGASVLRPAPTVSAGGVRSISAAVPTATAALVGGGALQAGMSPLTAAAMAASGALAPEAGRAFMRNNLMQTLLRDPNTALRQPLPTLPSILSITSDD